MGSDGGSKKIGGEEFVKTPADTPTAGKPTKELSSSSHHGPVKTFGPFSMATTEAPNPFFYRPPADPKDTPSHFPQNPMNLELHMRSERQRLVGMTPEEEEWRKKWVLDQKLHPDEPVYVEGAVNHLNPIRRLYRYPWDCIEQKILIPSMGLRWGHYTRAVVPKLMLGIFGTWCIYYYYKYNRPTWIDRVRSEHYLPRSYIRDEARIEEKYPGLMDKAFPVPKDPKDFYDLNFYRRTTHLDIGPPARPW
uniref:NADH dehydrogenase [ubiquinone] 1 beta subcomplex subunit 6 n=1 Tax=Trichuris muris TaxID=70415 RepID=A0A5S6Q938_TRIMR